MGNVKIVLFRPLKMGIIKRKNIKQGLNFHTSSSDNFNKVLFDFCLSELSYYNPIASDWDENSFGSWLIEFPKSRLIYDGKENFLTVQNKRRQSWCEDKYYLKDHLTSDVLEKIFKSIISKNDNHHKGLFNKKTLKFGGFMFVFSFVLTTLAAHFYGLPQGRYPGGSPYDLTWIELYANLPQFVEGSLILSVLCMVGYNEANAKKDKDLYDARKRIKEYEEKKS